MSTILIVVGSISVIIFVITSVMIYDFVAKRSQKIESFLFIRLYLFKYVSDYKNITKQETGSVGSLFYVWIISINLALVCFVILAFQNFS